MILFVCVTLCCGCAARQADAPAAIAWTRPILAATTPPAGSTVRGPLNDLRMRFDRPARLDEVLLNGPDGTTPMLIHAVGEVDAYSIPLPGLEAGAYTISWRATAQGQPYNGSFSFTVK